MENFGRLPRRQAEQVVHHQHLTVAIDARTDADGGNRKLGGDPCRQRGGHAFEHEQVGAGGLDGLRVSQQLVGGVLGLALDLVAAEFVHGLGVRPR